jgi:pyruvate dehydrogenase E2 component (dihydrolipoamide acetyltransferase)
MKDFRMPSLGADMEGGTLVEWLKSPGDLVQRGDIIAVVETVKGAIEIECFDDGVLKDIVAEPGTSVAVGEVLAHIEGGRATAMNAAPFAPASQSVAPGLDSRRQGTVAPPTCGAPLSAGHRASPAARRKADTLGLDIATIEPGPDGVIGLAEVDAAASLLPALPSTGEAASRSAKPGLDRDAMREAIGAAMAHSKREIPHYYVSSTVDVTHFFGWLEALNKGRSVSDRVLYAAPLTKAVALAVRATPALNGTFQSGKHHRSDDIHVGIATALRGGGLIAPALHDTTDHAIDDLMARLRDIVARVRVGRIRSSEMTAATITLSILGDDTADSVLPIIYPPQVAIIGCGAMRVRPWVIDGEIVARQLMNVTVAGDHRVSDGRVAARFLRRLEDILNQPEQL